MHFNWYQYYAQPSSTSIQQPHILNTLQRLAERDVVKDIWFHKMMAQVPES